ncbi:MAG: hypothetical protein KJ058_11310 [Thermoanaerobaculia bacterium]|nr:hypothetical protein [Thermoanaerobaculia bacterium]
MNYSRHLPPAGRALPCVLLGGLALALLVVAPAAADDRNLLKTGIDSPYVFVIFDTSGSMNWAPRCTQAQLDDGICDFLCPTGDCPVPRNGDDPASKFRQAKEALFEVVKEVKNIQFGFASFNQDDLAVKQKHWLYRVREGQTVHSLASGQQWPRPGGDEVFGPIFGCTTGSRIGCQADYPADIDVAGTSSQITYWERNRAQRIPKLGLPATTTTTVYLRVQNSTKYRVRYSPNGTVTYGNPAITVNVEIARCTRTDCSRVDDVETLPIVYDRVGDFVMWDYQASSNWDSGGYFGRFESTAGNTCAGTDPNDDISSDLYGSYNLRFSTTVDPLGRDDGTNPEYFTIGDQIPLDWEDNHRNDLLRRLAPGWSPPPPPSDPNDPPPPLVPPDPEDFAVARYLNDARIGSQTYLRLRDESERPILPNGSTPLGNSLSDFRSWYCNRSDSSNACRSGGWQSYAQLQDARWACRPKYLLVLTDGDETCNVNPCPYARILNTESGIRTYVIGFGVPNTSGNYLNCMAADGGTGEPIYPQNKEELVAALQNIFSEIVERTASFASAAVPTVQATVADKLFLSNFVPVRGEGVWSGRLQAFLKPLPLLGDGTPDTSVLCSADRRSQCYLWDAGDVQVDSYDPRGFLLQTPNPDDIDAGNLRIGYGVDERRVYYRTATTGLEPGDNRRLFNYPAAADEYDLWSGLGVEFNVAVPATITAARADTKEIVDYLLVEKTAEVTNTLVDPPVTHEITYVLGDIFHSDPVVVDAPRNALLYNLDPYAGNDQLCSANDPDRDPSTSYKDFVSLHACRRKVVMVGANDGQVHAFDAGTWQESAFCNPADSAVRYSDGTGRELFSWIPRAAMPAVRGARFGNPRTQEWSVDGRLRVTDVFIDPRHAGTPTCLDREWRSIAIGGLREGGRSYSALDITQPDVLIERTSTSPGVPPVSWVPQTGGGGYLATCAEGGADCGPLPYPAVLWEFGDSWDEDDNGVADLGETWSTPVIGRIRICTAGCGGADAETEDRWVAIFGGGMGETTAEASGNWLYMVDVETGRTIYKRNVIGSVPATVAAVDSDLDGYVDVAYFGTLAGWLYKVEIGSPSSPLALVDTTVRDYSTPNGAVPYTERAVTRITEARVRPFRVFSTDGRPIYQETSVIYVPQRQRLALAFGTGNRWNLWDESGQTGRFYAILDTGFTDSNRDGLVNPCPSGGGPCSSNGYRSEGDYQVIDPDDSYDPATPDYLFDGSDVTPGWVLRLDENEKVTTDPFAFSGIVSFTAYNPLLVVNADETCGQTGFSRIFVVKATNANPYIFPDENDTSLRSRYSVVGDFTTQPFVEQSLTKNPLADDDTRPTADELCTTASMGVMREELKRLFPVSCRFTNATIDIKTIRSDTGMVCIAPVPQCVAPRNWKEY